MSSLIFIAPSTTHATSTYEYLQRPIAWFVHDPTSW